MRPVLQVFARAPVPGHCKTRLIPALGAAGAAQLHERLVHHSLATAEEWLRSARQVAPHARVELWCAGDPQHPFFAACASAWPVQLKLQSGPDLGARMWLALCGALACGERPVLIGTDCPSLAVSELSAAFATMEGADAVYAPAYDGGYVLVGLARAIPELFAGIDWGSRRVMAATRKAAARTHARLAELRRFHDLDTPSDLARLRRAPQFAPLLAGLTP